MPDTELNETALFNEISKAISDNDVIKLSELTTEPAPKEEEQPQPDPPVIEKEPDVPAPDEPEKEEEIETSPPVKKADEEVVTPDAPEKTEAERLQEALDKLKELEKVNHNLKSQAGRIPSVQRHIRELDKKLEELTKRQASPSGQISEKLREQIRESLKDVRNTDEELATAVEKSMLEALSVVDERTRAQELETYQFLRDRESESYQQAETDRLLAMYPNAPDVFRSPHWKTWKSTKSDRIVALAESDNADDVALAFELYTKDMTSSTAPTESKTSAPDPEAVKKAQQIEAERAERLKKTAAVSSPNGPAKVSIPDDPQALFDKYVKEIQKQNS